MFVAGTLSGLLGIGSGAVKVLAMDRAMRLPFKVSTTTSNFMIGVTAAASAGVYLEPRLHRSRPGHAGDARRADRLAPGARVLMRAQSAALRRIFAAVIVLLGIEMIYNGLTGKFDEGALTTARPGRPRIRRGSLTMAGQRQGWTDQQGRADDRRSAARRSHHRDRRGGGRRRDLPDPSRRRASGLSTLSRRAGRPARHRRHPAPERSTGAAAT